MKHLADSKSFTKIGSPYLSHSSKLINSFLDPIDLTRFEAPAPAKSFIPPWSPSELGAPVPKPLDIIFPNVFFEFIDAAPPSATMMRFFNERVTRLRKRGLAPAWMPDQTFAPSDLPHILALAIVQGASGCLDLADILSETPKILFKLGDAVMKVRSATGALKPTNFDPVMTETSLDTLGDDVMKGQDPAIRDKCIAANLLTAATSITGLFPLGYTPFFRVINDTDVNHLEEIVFLCNWVAEGLGEQTIRREAIRAIRNAKSDVKSAMAASQYLYPETKSRFREVSREFEKNSKFTLEAPIVVEDEKSVVIENEPADALVHPFPAPSIVKEPSRAKPSARDLDIPKTPEGVILSSRAIKEILNERHYNEDRLADGFATLGLYRSMKMGRMPLETYRAALRNAYFEDSLCFADSGSLKTFERDYSVVVEGKKYVLDRHIKWGRGNNVISAIRIYYAWDTEKNRVIVGSAPRHLPIWTRS